MEYQKICEIRYKKTAEFLQAVGLDSKPVSYDRISVLLENGMLKREWVTMSFEQANLLVETIIEAKQDTKIGMGWL